MRVTNSISPDTAHIVKTSRATRGRTYTTKVKKELRKLRLLGENNTPHSQLGLKDTKPGIVPGFDGFHCGKFAKKW